MSDAEERKHCDEAAANLGRCLMDFIEGSKSWYGLIAEALAKARAEARRAALTSALIQVESLAKQLSDEGLPSGAAYVASDRIRRLFAKVNP